MFEPCAQSSVIVIGNPLTTYATIFPSHPKFSTVSFLQTSSPFNTMDKFDEATKVLSGQLGLWA